MCGIFGTINQNIALERVKPYMLHRGPDAQTTWSTGNVQLHHFRLTILDEAGGVQPMSRGGLTVIFNGEIYNHLEVRQQLGLTCDSRSDTETILAAYQQEGEACFDRFDGMFALAIYNRQDNTLLLARDRAGQKPLYVWQAGKSLVFSSELVALSKTVALDPDLKTLDNYYKGFLTPGKTPYQHVRQLLPGSSELFDCETGVSKGHKRWWKQELFYGSEQAIQKPYEQCLEDLQEILKTTVRRRVESSDLEVGAFLSGGIDSGLVVAAAAEVKSSLKTFTVAMPGAYNEAPLARLVANAFDTDHTEINITFDDLATDFPTIIGNYGEPFADSSAIPSYYVSAAAKKYLTVVLNGDGADELFAGYRRYVPMQYVDPFKTNKSRLAAFLMRLLPASHNKKSKYNYVYRLIDSLSRSGPEAYYSLTLDTFHSHSESFTRPLIDHSYETQYLSSNESWSSLRRLMGMDYNIILANDLLKKMDIATMAHSLEGRSPFLSKEIQEMAPALPDSYKLKGTKTKRILRDLAAKQLPIEISTQPKRGFEIPLKQWIDRDLSDFVQGYLTNDKLFVHEFITPAYIKSLLSGGARVSAEKRAKMLYQLLVTEMWARNNNYVA